MISFNPFHALFKRAVTIVELLQSNSGQHCPSLIEFWLGNTSKASIMSLFVASTCQILGDIIVNHVAWSRVDQIAALSAYTVDDNERETNQVLFTNNEVRLYLYPCSQ